MIAASTSRFPDQPEYGFSHALFREVAYSRLPRAARARKHRDAAVWLEAIAADRAMEIADMLANHLATAVEQATAAGAAEVSEATREPALHWVFAAGEAAIHVDEAGAFLLFDRARDLAIPGSSAHAHATARTAWLGRLAGTLPGPAVLERLEGSLTIERSLGDPSKIGGVLVRLGQQLGVMGDAERARAVFDDAIETLEGLPAGPDLARAYAFRAEEEMFAGHLEASLRFAERALSLGRSAGVDDVMVIALHIRGDGRCSSGDVGGLADLEEALAIAESGGNASEIVISHTYIGEWRWLLEGPASAVTDYERAIAVAEHRGAVNQGIQAKVAVLPALVELGEWDLVLGWTEELLAASDRLDPPLLVVTRCIRAALMISRGAAEDLEDAAELAALARPTEEIQVIALAAITSARLASVRGDDELARTYLREFDRITRDIVPTYRATNATAALGVCADLGDLELAEGILDPLAVVTPLEQLYVDSARAILQEMRGEVDVAGRAYADVEERWRPRACPDEAAAAAFGRGRCLRALRRQDDAARSFAAARQGFMELGAAPSIDRVDAATA